MTHENPSIKKVTTFKWRIDDFSRKAPLTKSYLSKYFKLNGTGIDAWLQFNPTNKDIGSKSHSTIIVGSASFNDQIIETLEFTLWLENSYGEVIARRSSKETPMDRKCPSYRSYFEFIHHDELYNSDFIKDDVVFICCKIGPKGFVNEDEQIPVEQDVREKMLSLYQQRITGNCTIQLEAKTFTLDKIFLMSHSPVFESMLTSEMQEAKTGIIKIADVDPSVMDIFIKYLYAGRVQKLDEFAEPLYILADKYKVAGLKAQCTKNLVDTLNKGNIIKRIVLGFMHNNVELKEAAIKYITKSGSDVDVRSLFVSGEWRDLLIHKPELANEITTEFFGKVQVTFKKS